MNRHDLNRFADEFSRLGYQTRSFYDGARGYVLMLDIRENVAAATLATKAEAERLLAGLRARKQVNR